MSSHRRRFTGRPSLALPALGAALALVVTSCSASTDSAVSGTVVSSSGSASASASATSTQALFPTPSASPSASASATPSASSPAPVPSVVTITVHAEPTASESKTSESESKKDSTCASDSASTVVSKALRELKNKSKWDQWTNVSEDYEGYDSCAELSWIDAIPGSSHKECCISSMVHHILLFHRGKFIGTATYEPYSFSPVITRTSDSSIRVTYRYMKEDEAPASASGSTTAEFTWNPAKNQVDMEGTPPPSYNS